MLMEHTLRLGAQRVQQSRRLGVPGAVLGPQRDACNVTRGLVKRDADNGGPGVNLCTVLLAHVYTN